jgi:hypothetical protein
MSVPVSASQIPSFVMRTSGTSSLPTCDVETGNGGAGEVGPRDGEDSTAALPEVPGVPSRGRPTHLIARKVTSALVEVAHDDDELLTDDDPSAELDFIKARETVTMQPVSRVTGPPGQGCRDGCGRQWGVGGWGPLPAWPRAPLSAPRGPTPGPPASILVIPIAGTF